jgi:hypothetical protein
MKDQYSTKLRCKLNVVLNSHVGLSFKTTQSIPTFCLHGLVFNTFLALISLILWNRRCGDLNPAQRLLFNLLSVKSPKVEQLNLLFAISQSDPPEMPQFFFKLP